MPIYLHFTHLYVKVLIFLIVYIYIESHISHSQILYHLEQLSFVVFRCSRIQRHIQLSYAYGSLVKVSVSVFKFSETTGPTDVKFHVAPPWDRGKDGTLIQMIKVICCYSLSSNPGARTFNRDVTTNLGPQCKAFSRALMFEKLKTPLSPGLEGREIQITGA